MCIKTILTLEGVYPPKYDCAMRMKTGMSSSEKWEMLYGLIAMILGAIILVLQLASVGVVFG